MKTQSVYGQIFLKALKTTWHHKILWLVGIPASFMASCGLLEAISGNWQTAFRGRILIEQAINGAIPGYEWFVSYQRYLGFLNPVHQYLILIVLFLSVLVIILVGAWSQGALFIGSLEKHPSGLKELLQKSQRFFGRILGLDILAKLAIFVLFLITVAPVAFLNPLPYSWHKYPPVISLILFLAGTILITAIQMLALSGVVHKHLNIRGAISEAWDIFRFHILTTIEIGILLFVASLVTALAAGLVLLVLSIPLTLFFVLATILANPVFYVLTIITSFATIFMVGFLASGFLAAFQYTVWSLYFEEAGRFGIVSGIRKLFKR